MGVAALTCSTVSLTNSDPVWSAAGWQEGTGLGNIWDVKLCQDSCLSCVRSDHYGLCVGTCTCGRECAAHVCVCVNVRMQAHVWVTVFECVRARTYVMACELSRCECTWRVWVCGDHVGAHARARAHERVDKRGQRSSRLPPPS